MAQSSGSQGASLQAASSSWAWCRLSKANASEQQGHDALQGLPGCACGGRSAKHVRRDQAPLPLLALLAWALGRARISPREWLEALGGGEARLLRGPSIVRSSAALAMRCDAMMPCCCCCRAAVSGESDEQAYTTAQYAAARHQLGCTSVVTTLLSAVHRIV